MYELYNQHPELNRLIGAAAVSKRFGQMLLQNPQHILEHNYLGYHFNLTPQEAAFVRGTVAATVQEFSLQVWEWMGRNGQQNRSGAHPAQAFRQMDGPFDRAYLGAPVSTDPTFVQEKRMTPLRFSTSQPTSPSWNGRLDMDPLILIVDDNREMGQGLKYAFEIEGFRVALVLDGEAAIEFMEQERPALILADIKMPHMDGYDLLRIVKQKAEWCDIPFVFLTAVADWREAVVARSKGADEFIVKPFELEALMNVVKRLTKTAEKAEVRSGDESGQRVNHGR